MRLLYSWNNFIFFSKKGCDLYSRATYNPGNTVIIIVENYLMCCQLTTFEQSHWLEVTWWALKFVRSYLFTNHHSSYMIYLTRPHVHTTSFHWSYISLHVHTHTRTYSAGEDISVRPPKPAPRHPHQNLPPGMNPHPHLNLLVKINFHLSLVMRYHLFQHITLHCQPRHLCVALLLHETDPLIPVDLSLVSNEQITW